MGSAVKGPRSVGRDVADASVGAGDESLVGAGVGFSVGTLVRVSVGV